LNFQSYTLGSGEFSGLKEDLSLEFSVFLVQLNNSCFKIGNSGSFISSFFVEGVNEVDSEVVEGCNNDSKRLLTGEVLFGGELEEGSDESGELVVALELVMEVLDVSLDLLDLNKGWVGDGTKEFKAFIDGSDGIGVFSSSSFKGSLIVGSLFGFGVKSLSVFFNVRLELSEGLGDSGSLWDQDVVGQILSVEEVSFSIFNGLGELCNNLVVFTGSLSEVGVGGFKFVFKIVNNVFHGFKKVG
jgi:hypothetical protein